MQRAERRLGTALVMPALVILGLILAVPTLFAFAYSLADLRLARVVGFAGFDNWLYAVFVPETWNLLGRTFAFVVGTTGATLILAMVIALWLDRLTRNLTLALQLVVILPWVLSGVVSSLLFRWTWLESLGLGAWMSEELTGGWTTPMLTGPGAMGSLIIVNTWRTLGFTVLLLLAGLKSLDHDLYEAAKVDGANALQRFWNLTIPLMRTPLTIVTVVLLMSALNNAEVPLTTTGGGPGESTVTLALRIYRLAFVDLDFGASAALATAAMALNVIFVIFYVRLTNEKGDER